MRSQVLGRIDHRTLMTLPRGRRSIGLVANVADPNAPDLNPPASKCRISKQQVSAKRPLTVLQPANRFGGRAAQHQWSRGCALANSRRKARRKLFTPFAAMQQDVTWSASRGGTLHPPTGLLAYRCSARRAGRTAEGGK